MNKCRDTAHLKSRGLGCNQKVLQKACMPTCDSSGLTPWEGGTRDGTRTMRRCSTSNRMQTFSLDYLFSCLFLKLLKPFITNCHIHLQTDVRLIFFHHILNNWFKKSASFRNLETLNYGSRISRYFHKTTLTI